MTRSPQDQDGKDSNETHHQEDSAGSTIVLVERFLLAVVSLMLGDHVEVEGAGSA